jgi:hypothetical protein
VPDFRSDEKTGIFIEMKVFENEPKKDGTKTKKQIVIYLLSINKWGK